MVRLCRAPAPNPLPCRFMFPCRSSSHSRRLRMHLQDSGFYSFPRFLLICLKHKICFVRTLTQGVIVKGRGSCQRQNGLRSLSEVRPWQSKMGCGALVGIAMASGSASETPADVVAVSLHCWIRADGLGILEWACILIKGLVVPLVGLAARHQLGQLDLKHQGRVSFAMRSRSMVPRKRAVNRRLDLQMQHFISSWQCLATWPIWSQLKQTELTVLCNVASATTFSAGFGLVIVVEANLKLPKA